MSVAGKRESQTNLLFQQTHEKDGNKGRSIISVESEIWECSCSILNVHIPKVLSDSCLFCYLFFPKVLTKCLIFNSYCSRDSSSHWVFLLYHFVLTLCSLCLFIGNAVFCIFSLKRLISCHFYYLFLETSGPQGSYFSIRSPVSPSKGVPVIIVSPGLVKGLFFVLGEGIAITLSISVSVCTFV